jgi:signal transduction histidine kinase
MRLLNITNRYYIGLLVILLVAWSSLLYYVLRFEVYDNIDEVLKFRKNLLVNEIKKQGELPFVDNYHDFIIKPIEKMPVHFRDVYQDTLVHKWRKSYDEYRRITSYFELKGKPYSVSFTLPHMEEDEIIDTMAYTIPVFLVMLLVGYSIMAAQLNKKIWRPFYTILDKFKAFHIESGMKLEFDHANVKEFRELQLGVKELTNRSIEVFLQQKQFTENASHEIQTPLAIMQAKLELLFQDSMTKKQSEILGEVFNAVDRLSKINQTLLLLTKIENNQFPEKKQVQILSAVGGILPYFDEQSTKYNINVEVDISEEEILETNTTLFSILITNLIKNAFVHNLPNGKIKISARNKSIEISNTGTPLEVQPDKLFERFYTQASGKGGAGLGLALVKGICNLNQWSVSYNYVNGLHKIQVAY